MADPLSMTLRAKALFQPLTALTAPYGFRLRLTQPLAISGTPAAATANSAYSFAPIVAGGNGTRSFALTTGTLPTGLTLDTTTGVISGTPTVTGTTSGLVLTVTDYSGSRSLTFSITVS